MREHAQSNDDVGRDMVQLLNPEGKGGVVLVCEHASHVIPEEFSNLGLGADALVSHIAWDPGAWAVAQQLSAAFDAPLVAPAVSRLVYDCNRPAVAESAVPKRSEIYDIPGNLGVGEAERLERAKRFYQPYRDALMAVIAQAVEAGRAPAVITIHSFTPVYQGQKRTLDLGILHDTDARLADEILKITQADGDFLALCNEPYGPADGVTYTLAEHAVPRQLLNVMIEIRNDLIADPASQQTMANWLGGVLNSALENLGASAKSGEAL